MADVDDSENIRIRLGGDLRKRWKQLIDDRKISQQRAIVAAIEFLCDQEPLTTAMIFQQVPNTDRAELSRIVLDRLAASGKRKR